MDSSRRMRVERKLVLSPRTACLSIYLHMRFADRRTGGFPGEIGVTGKTAFDRNDVDAPKELLQSLEIRFAFDPGQMRSPSSARVMPAFGNERRVGRHIVGSNQLETGRADQSLVLSGWQKKIGTDRTARLDLL